MKRCVAVDWLSVYCKSDMIVRAPEFEFHKLESGSAQFSEVWNVYNKYDRELYCTVQRKPYSPIIPKDAIMVKVANRYLYKQNWNVTLNNFFLACNIQPVSISRIDISCDFNRFANNLHPENLIAGVMNKKYIKTGCAKFAVQGDQTAEQMFDYLRFGNRDSQCSVYLYNKSKELREVKDKPYIREMWSNSGLDTSQDVWRLEISMRTTQLRLIIPMTGEIFRLDLDFIKTQGIVENVYNCAIDKYFDIRINDGQAKKTRMKRVKLFDSLSTTLLMVVPTNEACTNRMDKIVVKKLANYFSQYRIEDEGEQTQVMAALEVILKQTDLWSYFYERVRPEMGWYKER